MLHGATGISNGKVHSPGMGHTIHSLAQCCSCAEASQAKNFCALFSSDDLVDDAKGGLRISPVTFTFPRSDQTRSFPQNHPSSRTEAIPWRTDPVPGPAATNQSDRGWPVVHADPGAQTPMRPPGGSRRNNLFPLGHPAAVDGAGEAPLSAVEIFPQIKGLPVFLLVGRGDPVKIPDAQSYSFVPQEEKGSSSFSLVPIPSRSIRLVRARQRSRRRSGRAIGTG